MVFLADFQVLVELLGKYFVSLKCRVEVVGFR